jgi:DNA-binding transcriptional ArsR family regulator
LASWRFLTNHGLVYLHKVLNPDSTVREIAFDLGVTERAVHRVLRDLVRDGYLLKERVGRRAYYRATSQQMTLRHQPVLNVDVKELMAALTGGRYSEPDIPSQKQAAPAHDGAQARPTAVAASADRKPEPVGQAVVRP